MINDQYLVPAMLRVYKEKNPRYPASVTKDAKPLRLIAEFINEQNGFRGEPPANMEQILGQWGLLAETISADPFYSTKSLLTISNHIQEIFSITAYGNPKNKKLSAGALKAKISDLYPSGR